MNHPTLVVWLMPILLIAAPLTASAGNSDEWKIESFSVKVFFEMPDGSCMHANAVLMKNTTALNATVQACDALGIPIEYSFGKYGAFVTSINSFSAPPDYSWWWELLVWNATSMHWEESYAGASSLNLSPGDCIAWCPNSTAPPPFSPLYEEFKPSFVSSRVQNITLSSAENFLTQNLNNGPIDTTPCVINGRIYISTGGVYDWKNMTYKEKPHAYCLDISSGKKVWEREISASGWQISSPCYGSGMIFIGTTDGNLYALSSSTGDILWNYKMASITSSPLFVNGYVYVADGNGTLFCMDKGGRLAWKHEGGGGNYMSSPVFYAGGILYGTDDGNLYYVKNGTEVWKVHVEGKIRATPAVFNNNIYVVSTKYDGWTATESNIYAIRGGKVVKWRKTEASVSSPLVFEDRVYLGTSRGLLCLDTSLNFVWEYCVEEPVQSSPCTDGESIFFATNSEDGKVYACSKDGYEVWSKKIGDYILSSPVIANGHLIVCADDGYVRVFGKMVEKKIEMSVESVGGSIYVNVKSLGYSGDLSLSATIDGEHTVNSTIQPGMNSTFKITPEIHENRKVTVMCKWDGEEIEKDVEILPSHASSAAVDLKLAYLLIISAAILLFLMLILWDRERKEYEEE